MTTGLSDCLIDFIIKDILAVCPDLKLYFGTIVFQEKNLAKRRAELRAELGAKEGKTKVRKQSHHKYCHHYSL